jgi:hypothetical protein
MPKPFINVRVLGVERILRKLNKADPIHAKPWTKALRSAADLVQSGMRQTAPGTLGARVTTRLHARPVPLFAKVGLLPMPSRKGFRYPGALHGGAMYHYRSGSNSGQQTKGWLTKPLKVVQGRINDLLSRAAGEIKNDWESG